MGDAADPPDRIDVENYAMRDALAFDDGLASLAVEGEAAWRVSVWTRCLCAPLVGLT